MFKFLQNLYRFTITKINSQPKQLNKNRYIFKSWDKSSFISTMDETKAKDKVSPSMEEVVPVKKIKLDGDPVSPERSIRTVSTMCGAWRPDEVDGGLVLVFKTRDPGLSPNPTRECDFPENIEDFWVAAFADSESDQVTAGD
ncbi:hypothetical protein JYU34_002847 [Plutella xylostella]|uniref:Uncharacterized protein n=1 Tax=Plutella xylostella TaxID=51655 RepID=A0ABQ7R3D7_PLUXY|nr:hypothetical protein JYU34_002847 [Plutella xylostella]